MKIICVDNFDRDHVPDVCVAKDISPAYGELIVALLNQHERAESPRFYKLVEDNHVLKKASYE